MPISKDRENLKSFLIERTNFHQSVAVQIARTKILDGKKLAGIEQSVSDDEIKEYLIKNSEDISNRSDEVLDDVCRRMIPDHKWHDGLVSFGILSVFIVPAISILVHTGLKEFQSSDLKSASASFVCALLLLIPLVVSTFKSIRK